MKYIAALIFLLFSISTVYAFDVNTIADFVIANNPEVEEVRKYENNIFRNVKIDAKAAMYRQEILRDEKQQALYSAGYILETTATGKRFEVIMTIPLLDLRERAERRVKNASFISTKRADIVKIAAKLKALMDFKDFLSASLKTEKAELDWMKKRVEAGIDYQKDFNAATHKYNQNLYRYYETLGQIAELTETLTSMVYENQREKLRELIGYIHDPNIP